MTDIRPTGEVDAFCILCGCVPCTDGPATGLPAAQEDDLVTIVALANKAIDGTILLVSKIEAERDYLFRMVVTVLENLRQTDSNAKRDAEIVNYLADGIATLEAPQAAAGRLREALELIQQTRPAPPRAT